MKINIAILSAIVILMLTGCSKNIKPVEKSDKLAVATSIYPIYDFASKIAGEHADVSLFMPNNADAHDWEPTASDIVSINSSDIFIYNGAEMEHWAETVISALDNKATITVEASANIQLEDENEHNEDSQDHGAFDPHVWLSPKNAKIQLTTIAKALSDADNANAEYYNKNLQLYINELDKLDLEYQNALANVPMRKIVVAHEAYGYLCHEYNLEQISVRGFSPDSEPDPAQMAEVIKIAMTNNIKVIFFEESTSPRIAKVIADEIGATTAVLSPIESLSEQQIKNGDDYFSVMRQNLVAIVSALT